MMLTVINHDRDVAGMKYVYPVLSRRAKGISIGINLNVNNACNWACVYCQVPNLTRGKPPAVDLLLLESELRGFLQDALFGDFLKKNAPEPFRQIVDVAFSGNGEPTSSFDFAAAVMCISELLNEFKVRDKIKLRLITNGSFMHRAVTREGIALIGKLNGEVWFKIDSATAQGIAAINNIRLSPMKIKKSLLQCCELAPTWIQTCYFARNGQAPDAAENLAYLAFIDSVSQKIKGVHLYGLARPSMQLGSQSLAPLSPDELGRFAEKITQLGISVIVNP